MVDDPRPTWAKVNMADTLKVKMYLLCNILGFRLFALSFLANLVQIHFHKNKAKVMISQFVTKFQRAYMRLHKYTQSGYCWVGVGWVFLALQLINHLCIF